MAEEEIDYYDQELNELLDDIAKDFKKLEKLKDPEKRQERISDIQDRMNRAKNSLQSMKIELRDLPKERKPDYDPKVKDFEATIAKFKQDLQWAKAGGERSDLLNGAATPDPSKPLSKRDQEKLQRARERGMEDADPDSLTAQELISVGEKVQDRTKGKTKNILRLVEESKQVGTATNEKLKQQTEQIKKISDDVDQIESNLKRADKIIRSMLRGVVTDKIAIALMVLILGAVIFLIAWKVTHKNANLNIGGVTIPSFTPTPSPIPLSSITDLAASRGRTGEQPTSDWPTDSGHEASKHLRGVRW
eukprot:CAMPEP_0196662968 /NCGR_PEP_ID=MMETSP1086-20130531/51060_1 /TAXON_ID=77921 /ORGANISM="Cyanoptyche  gloeocystis , Strain SAG4.97" /LENGTH=304 /DNA_ID=CAMNT_0041998609 /DNA_START=104 /DNA_END=1015 /DNA_ORIENTATION=+